jgi:hypothetical protein
VAVRMSELAGIRRYFGRGHGAGFDSAKHSTGAGGTEYKPRDLRNGRRRVSACRGLAAPDRPSMWTGMSLVSGTLVAVFPIAINLRHEAGTIGKQAYWALAVVAIACALVTPRLLGVRALPKRWLGLLRSFAAVGTITQHQETQL